MCVPCSANKCRIRESDLQAVCLYIIFLNWYYISEWFGCNAIAFFPEYKDIAEELSWSEIGISLDAHSYAYESGHYKSVEQYE